MKGPIMLSSLKVLAPEDSEEVGTRVSDFLETAGWTALIVTAAVFVLTFILTIVIAKKAGYSGWWGALAVLVPGLGFILFLLFAMLKWPSLKERDEAIGVIDANDLMLPSRERAAVKEAERRKQVEADARARMEQARSDREKAEAESARYRRAQAADQAEAAAAADSAAAPAEAPAKKDDAPADTTETKSADGPAKESEPATKRSTAPKPDDKPADKPDDKPADKPDDKPDASKEG